MRRELNGRWACSRREVSPRALQDPHESGSMHFNTINCTTRPPTFPNHEPARVAWRCWPLCACTPLRLHTVGLHALQI